MRLVETVLVAALLCAAAPAAEGKPAVAAAAARPIVCVVPLGGYEKSMVPTVSRGIEYLYHLEVRLLEPRALPSSAWYSPRRRYRAGRPHRRRAR